MKEIDIKDFTYNEIMGLLRKHYDNSKVKYPLGSKEYSLIMRFFEPLQDDIARLKMGKKLIEFNEDGTIKR